MAFFEKKEGLAFLVFFLVFLLVLFAGIAFLGRSTSFYSQAFLVIIPDKTVQDSVDFSFVIQNHENAAVEYTYIVFFDSKKISEKQVFVEKGKGKELREVFFVTGVFEGKKKVLVEIFRPGYEEPFTLSFWVSYGG